MRLDAVFKKRLSTFELDMTVQTDAPDLVLWGASGAGKTLTLNCLSGFARPDTGRILVNGNLFFDAATQASLPPQRRRCGYIFQDHALFPHMTVLENLRFAASVSNRPGKARIKELLETFELGDITNRKPNQLSGGQQQRAALARALISEPTLLLLDEPTQGLDQRLKRSFYELLRQIRKESMSMVVLVTHDLEECFQLNGHICLLENGKLLQSGSALAVLSRPASVAVARLLGIYNIVPAEIEFLDPANNRSRLRTSAGPFTGIYYKGCLLGDKGFAVFRASSLKVSPVSESGLTVKSTQVHSYGASVELNGGLSALIPAAFAADIHPGTCVQVQVEPSDIVFLTR